MSPFEYLSVLVSVIVGLGLSHLLTSSARLIQRRRQIALYPPTLLWMGTLFLLQIQIWWVAYQNRSDPWTFFSFLGFLLIPILGYLLCYLVVPDLDTEAVELRRTYHENRGWFFGLVIVMVVVSFVRDVVGGGISFDANTAFRVVFGLLAGAAIVVKREGYHLANAMAGLALFTAYVFVEFLRLR